MYRSSFEPVQLYPAGPTPPDLSSEAARRHELLEAVSSRPATHGSRHRGPLRRVRSVLSRLA